MAYRGVNTGKIGLYSGRGRQCRERRSWWDRLFTQVADSPLPL